MRTSAGRKWSLENIGNRMAVDARLAAVTTYVRPWSQLSKTAEVTVLDLGSGIGSTLEEIDAAGLDGGHVVALDLSHSRLRSARTHRATPVCGAGQALPFPANTFDLVFAFTVFSSVPGISLQRRVAAEVDRVLRPGGAVVWYDMRWPSYNRAVRPVRSRTIASLFPAYDLSIEAATLLPVLGRAVGRLQRPSLYTWLETLPWLRSHYLAYGVKPDSSAIRVE